MEAIVVRSLRVISLTTLVLFPLPVLAAHSARTQNFIVSAPTRALANEIAQEAERFRKELAISWLGHELPPWQDPCPVQADVNPRKGAGGMTSFLFETEQRQFARPVGDGLFQAKPAGRPFGWEMSVQGSRERILDSVLPHEVTHTIFATHFGRPLPRWADEGACTTVEHESEKAKQHRMLYEFLTTERGIAFNEMFSLTEYPADMLPLYSQGFSLARYLIEQGGRQKFVKYISHGLASNNWTEATSQHYGYDSISDLQVTWLEWVRGGCREIPRRQRDVLIASNTPRGGTTFRETSQTIAENSWIETAGERDPQVVGTRDQQADAKSLESPGSSNATETSWYAQQKNKTTRRTQAKAASRFVKSSAPRVATRLSPGDQTREVLLEWGKPSQFLNPTLLR